MNPVPPITRALVDALQHPGATDARKLIVANAVQRIGVAFEGIENHNLAGRNEPLLRAVERFKNQHSVPVRIDTLLALADRINELSAIVEQTALTRDDLPHAGWGVPQEPQVPEASEDAEPTVEVTAALLSKGDRIADGLGTVAGKPENVNDENGAWVAVETSDHTLLYRPDEGVNVLAYECCECGKPARSLSPGDRCSACEFDLSDEVETLGRDLSEHAHPDDTTERGW